MDSHILTEQEMKAKAFDFFQELALDTDIDASDSELALINYVLRNYIEKLLEEG